MSQIANTRRFIVIREFAMLSRILPIFCVRGKKWCPQFPSHVVYSYYSFYSNDAISLDCMMHELINVDIPLIYVRVHGEPLPNSISWRCFHSVHHPSSHTIVLILSFVSWFSIFQSLFAIMSYFQCLNNSLDNLRMIVPSQQMDIGIWKN